MQLLHYVGYFLLVSHSSQPPPAPVTLVIAFLSKMWLNGIIYRRDKKMRYKYVVFDVDGTLLNTEESILQSFQKTLRECAGIEKERAELTFCLGITGAAALKRLGIGNEEEILSQWKDNMSALNDLVHVFDGVEMLLKRLRDRGVRMGIVTSRSRAEYERDFLRLGLDGYFDTVVCEEDTTCHKPEAEPLECYRKKTGARPEEVLYIGDSIYDMECAAAANTACGLALWGAGGVKHIHADYYFPDPASVLSVLDRLEAENEGRKWLSWAMELQFIAQAGITYTKDRFDLERFERIRELSGEIMGSYTGLSKELVTDLFCSETGFQTPKLDTRAAIIEDGKILLVKEKNGCYSMPGGWVDVNKTVGENVVKETLEEAGLTVVPVRVVALHDKNLHNPPAFAYGVCKVFFLCEIVEGEFTENIETVESGWFSPDELPVLAEDRNTKEQIQMCFDAYADQNWKTVFE